jgi:hypothetical protein
MEPLSTAFIFTMMFEFSFFLESQKTNSPAPKNTQENAGVVETAKKSLEAVS